LAHIFGKEDRVDKVPYGIVVQK